jgi:hypothetical protein
MNGTYSTEVEGRMHSKETKITDLVREHLQTKEKIRMGWRVERERKMGREQICSLLLSDLFSEE